MTVDGNDSFLSLSRIAIRFARTWDRAWPFDRLRNLPTRFINRGLRSGLLHPVWFEVKPGLQMRLDMRDVIQEALLLNNTWDPGVTEIILGNLTPGMTFLDIGANVGYFSLLAARRVGPSGRVIAVEPNPEIANQFGNNIRRNELSNITVVQAACADSSAPRELYLAEQSNTGKSSFSSKNANSQASISVECLTADELIQKLDLFRLDLVKLDVEGAELPVLRGMTRTLSHWHPKLILEIAPRLLENFSTKPDEVISFVEGLGYRVQQSRKEADYTDYLFAPG